jgi:hypothetical protein
MIAITIILITANIIALIGLVIQYYTFKKWDKQDKN